MSRYDSNEIINQLFGHIMTGKRLEDGKEDIFTPKTIRKASATGHDKQRRMSRGMDTVVKQMKRLGSTSISSGSQPSKSPLHSSVTPHMIFYPYNVCRHNHRTSIIFQIPLGEDHLFLQVQT